MTHRPLVSIVISFVIGITIDYFVNVPFFIILSAIIVSICFFVFSFRTNNLSQICTIGPSVWASCWQTRTIVWALLLLTFTTGITYHHARYYSSTSNNISNFLSSERIPVHLRGIVVTQPVSKSTAYSPRFSTRQQGKLTTFLLRAEAIESRGIWKEITGVIKVNVYPTRHEEGMLGNEKGPLKNKLNYGNRTELIGHVSVPSGPANPGQFSYKAFLQKQNPRIEAIASVVNINNINLISENHGNYFFTFIYGLKKKLNSVIEKHVNEGSVPLVSSILLGDREKLPGSLTDSFMKTGTIHFLAISGLHVGILIVSLHYLLRRLGVSTKTLSIAIITFAFFYAAITGMKTPITRSCIMVAAYYGAFIFNRRWDLPNSIAVAVFVILLVNPSDLFNVGFQLSVLAVLGIIYISNRIESCFWKSTLLVERLQAKEERNEIWFIFKIYCRKTLCVSLAAWIAVMPLIAHYFHLVTPLTVLLNIVVFPLIWTILVGGFIVLILGMVIPILATPFALLTSYSGFVLENIISLFSANLKTFYYTSGPSWVWISIYYSIVILFIIRERLKIRMAHMLFVTLAALNIFVISGILAPDQNSLKLTCFDVKHGTSILIQFPNGKNMLVDTGTWSNYDVGKFVVAPFLWRAGIKEIDTIVLTHEHEDHCNGIPSLIERFNVGNVYINKFFLQTGNKKELLRFITEKNIKIGLLANGLEIQGYGPAKITILNPLDRDILEANGFSLRNLSVNDTSCVLLIEYLGHKILLCADIGESGIEMLLSGKEGLDADVIQVPHHGGFCTKTEDLISQTKPEYALISGTKNNLSTATSGAYEKSGSILYKTYRDGAITFTINQDGIQVSSFLKEQISN